MKHETLHQWCKAATAKIRYKPDRKLVYEELMAHLEDKCDELRESGCPEEEIELRAVEAMGDAGEIAPQLGALHKPFWGYVYSIVKWIAIWTLVLCLGVALLEWQWNLVDPDVYRTYEAGDVDAYFTQQEDGSGRQIYYAKLTEHALCGGYWYTLTDVALWDPGWPGALYGNTELATLHIRIREVRVLGEYESSFFSRVWAQDSQGRKYDCGKNLAQRNAVTQEYDMWLVDFQAEGVEWVELHYQVDGRSITFHIDLTEVEV